MPKIGNTEGCKVVKVGKDFNSDGIPGIYSSTFKDSCVNGLANGISGALTFTDGRVCDGRWLNGTAVDVRCTMRRTGIGSEQARVQDTSPPAQSSENTGEKLWLGQRIIKMAGDDPKSSPSPWAAKEILAECKFEGDDPASYSSKSCEIHNVAPGRARKSEKLSITPISARCCLRALNIYQLQSDFEGGLDLFTLPELKKSKLSCPEMEEGNTAGNGTEFWLILKDSVPKFVVREDTSSGSGGSSKNITVFFETTTAKCSEFKLIEAEIDDHGKIVYLDGEPKKGGTQNSGPAKSAPMPQQSAPSKPMTAPVPQQQRAPSSASSRYSNSVACLVPHSPGMAATMATTLMQMMAENPIGFGHVMTNPTYAKHCQLAYGVPGDDNIQRARLVKNMGGISYWVADRGTAAIGFIERR